MEAGRELDALVAEKVMGLWPKAGEPLQCPTDAAKCEPKLNGPYDLPEPERFFYKCDFCGRPGPNAGTPERAAYLWNLLRVPHYSNQIAAAWQVVEKLAPKFRIALVYGEKGTFWHCSCGEHIPGGYKFSGSADADTAPLAIALAALKACGVEL